MIERAEQHLKEIQGLLENPTPENFAEANGKLEQVAVFVSSIEQSLRSSQPCDVRVRAFVGNLPAEMRKIRVLMQAPVEFFRGVNALWSAYSESYDGSGHVKSCELQFSSGTLMHL